MKTTKLALLILTIAVALFILIPNLSWAADDGAALYKAKCAACHNTANVALKKRMCPVAKQACTSCHMPRVEPPEAHHAFADHDIRIVRSKSDYPG